MSDEAAPICKRCGAVWRPGIDRFDEPEPLAGCRPGRIWVNYRADRGAGNKVVCVYGDGERGAFPYPTAPPAPVDEHRRAG